MKTKTNRITGNIKKEEYVSNVTVEEMEEYICKKTKMEFIATPFQNNEPDEDGIMNFVSHNQTYH